MAASKISLTIVYVIRIKTIFSVHHMLLFVLSKFEIISLFLFVCVGLSLNNVSHFDIVRSVCWLIPILQTARSKSRFTARQHIHSLAEAMQSIYLFKTQLEPFQPLRKGEWLQYETRPLNQCDYEWPNEIYKSKNNRIPFVLVVVGCESSFTNSCWRKNDSPPKANKQIKIQPLYSK